MTSIKIRRDTVPFDRRFCAIAPCDRPAEVIFCARPACLSCANKARAFLNAQPSGVNALLIEV